VNKGEEGGDFDAVALSAEGPPEPAPEEPAADPTPAPDGTTKGGCACTTTGEKSAAPTFALLGLALLVATRRRR
jgi:MYXO-CTERM domain-containing protein